VNSKNNISSGSMEGTEDQTALRYRHRSLAAVLARWLIRLYQLTLSPFIGNQCRFHPSCSNYALDAVDRWGAIRGSWLALKRLGRCHPFHAGGFDPVPGATPDTHKEI
jgi:putative membrane protein insertion efficiency factor